MDIPDFKEDPQVIVSGLHAKVEEQAVQIEELRLKVQEKDGLLQEQAQEKNLLQLKIEVLIDMLAYKTAENTSLCSDNTKMRTYLDKRLEMLKCDISAET